MTEKKEIDELIKEQLSEKENALIRYVLEHVDPTHYDYYETDFTANTELMFDIFNFAASRLGYKPLEYKEFEILNDYILIFAVTKKWEDLYMSEANQLLYAIFYKLNMNDFIVCSETAQGVAFNLTKDEYAVFETDKLTQRTFITDILRHIDDEFEINRYKNSVIVKIVQYMYENDYMEDFL